MTDVRSAALPGSDTWIVSTSLDKPDEQTRRFIRSHVMRGKNTRVCRRSRRMVGPKAYDRQDKPVERPGPAGDKAWVVTTPHRVASEIELFGLDIELRPYMLDLIHRGMFSTCSLYHVDALSNMY